MKRKNKIIATFVIIAMMFSMIVPTTMTVVAADIPETINDMGELRYWLNHANEHLGEEITITMTVDIAFNNGIPNGTTPLEIPFGVTLIINRAVTLNNEIINNGTIIFESDLRLNNGGTITNSESGTIIVAGGLTRGGNGSQGKFDNKGKLVVIGQNPHSVDGNGCVGQGQQITSPATCVSEGGYEVKCKDCNDVLYIGIIPINPNNHDGERYEDEIEAATCIAVGEMGIYCKDCDALLDTDEIEINEDNHAGEETDDVTLEATCVATGLKDVYCADCEELLESDVEIEIDALAHTPGEEADCINAQICTECEAELEEALGHGHAAVVTAPTCLNRGFTTYTCFCDNEYVDNYVDALGHDFSDEWVVTTAATYAAAGVETRTCSRCPETETRAIPALAAPAGPAVDNIGNFGFGGGGGSEMLADGGVSNSAAGGTYSPTAFTPGNIDSAPAGGGTAPADTGSAPAGGGDTQYVDDFGGNDIPLAGIDLGGNDTPAADIDFGGNDIPLADIDFGSNDIPLAGIALQEDGSGDAVLGVSEMYENEIALAGFDFGIEIDESKTDDKVNPKTGDAVTFVILAMMAAVITGVVIKKRRTA